VSELVFMPAHQLAKGIREGNFSALEVLEAHLAQIVKHNPQVNAIITLDEQGARQRALAADAALAKGEIWGVLHGVPITIKDYLETAGLRTTSSYPPLANYIPERDATVVARLRAVGAIILGKTNLPMLAQGIQSDSPLFGRTNNPWNLAYTPGGSSGGGAAAVAAGLSPLDIGGDIGGSIRIPAHFCGIFGLKPTEHRVSNAGCIGRDRGLLKSVRHLRVLGPLARSVEDLELCLSIIEGEDGRDWEVCSPPSEIPSLRELSTYRFAWTDDFGGVPVTFDTRSTLEKWAIQLEGLGCRVEYISPDKLDFALALQTCGEILGMELGVLESPLLRSLVPLLRIGLNAKISDNPLAQGILQGVRLNFRRYAEALTRRDTLIGQLEAFLSEWDAWLCPVACGSAFKHLKISGNIDSWLKVLPVDKQILPYNVWGLTHTPLFNLTGHPVVVIPVGKSQDGLPIGVQIVGKRWRDRELLKLAKALTEVVGIWQCPPGF
jgi:amidase